MFKDIICLDFLKDIRVKKFSYLYRNNVNYALRTVEMQMNTIKCGLSILVMLLIAGNVNSQTAEVRLVAQSTHGHNGTAYYISDTTAYVYSGARGSNMATGVHLYDSSMYWSIIAGVPVQRNKWQRSYDANNRIATHTASVYTGTVWRNTVKYAYSYLSGNAYDSVYEWRWDTTAALWNLKRVQVYTYKAGNIDTIHWLKPGPGGLIKEGHDIYTYTNGSIASHALLMRNDSMMQWDEWQRELYNYNTAGRLDTYTVYRIDFGTLQTLPASREVFQYGANNMVSSHWYYNWFAPALRWEGDYWHYYSYNSNNTIDIETVNYWDMMAQQWGPQSRFYYYYDVNQNTTDIVEMRFVYPNYENYVKQTWVYNNKNNPERYSKYYWIAATAFWMPEQSTNSRVNYYYEDDNTSIDNVSTIADDWVLYPNPATGSIVTLSAKNAANYDCKVLLTDIQGRLLGKYDMQRGDKILQIPVGQLLQGIYMLRIQFADKEMTKTLSIAR